MNSLTIDWKSGATPFEGWSDWRLHWSALALATIAIYAWLWKSIHNGLFSPKSSRF